MNGDDFVKINFEVNPKDEDDKELIFSHSLLHTLFKKKEGGSSVEVGGENRTLEDIINYHAIVIQEMKKRGIKHNFIDELDRRTYDLLGWDIPGGIEKKDRLYSIVVKLSNPLEGRSDLDEKFSGLQVIGWEDLSIVRKAIDSESMTLDGLREIIDEIVALQRHRGVQANLKNDFNDLTKMSSRNLNLLLALMRNRRNGSNEVLDEIESEVESVLKSRLEPDGDLQKEDDPLEEGSGSRGSTSGDEEDVEGDTEAEEPDDLDKAEADAFLVIPDEDKSHDFVIQEHWAGKSVHSDLRFESDDPKFILGWTLNTQVAGAVKEPVTTLAEAQSHPKNFSKINWTTGEFNKRGMEGTSKKVNVQIASQRKSPQARPWLTIEGRTKLPVEGEAPPIGATKEFPGVWNIVDRGKIEFGSQQRDFHEYFPRGSAFDYRIMFRKLDDSWVLIKPIDQLPYVLSSGAVNDRYIPAQGRSALPSDLRSKVPDRFSYWKPSEEKERIELRDQLVSAMKAGEVDLGIKEIEKSDPEGDLSGKMTFSLTSPPIIKSDEVEFLKDQVPDHDHGVELDEDKNGLSSVNFSHCHAVEDLDVEVEDGHSHEIAKMTAESTDQG